jgi:hypothetical protein
MMLPCNICRLNAQVLPMYNTGFHSNPNIKPNPRETPTLGAGAHCTSYTPLARYCLLHALSTVASPHRVRGPFFIIGLLHVPLPARFASAATLSTGACSPRAPGRRNLHAPGRRGRRGPHRRTSLHHGHPGRQSPRGRLASAKHKNGNISTKMEHSGQLHCQGSS